MKDLKKFVSKGLKKVIPGTKVSYTKKTGGATYKHSSYSGQTTKRRNTPKYKVPNTPKVSGKGWGH